MIDKTGIKHEARLAAIEYLLCDLHAELHRMAPPAVRADAQNDLMTRLDQLVVPWPDPVMADAATAEFRDAVQNLLDMVDEMANG